MKTRLSKLFESMNKYHLQYLFFAIFFLLLFIILTILVITDKTIILDFKIRDFAYQIRGEKYGIVYYFFRLITEFGFVFILIPIFFLFLVFTRLDLRAAILGFGTLITYLVNTFVKILILRERPLESMQWMSESSYSYPSGHSMTSMFFYFVMIYFIITAYRPNKQIKISLVSFFSVITLLIGFSRIILGVHYFTDVIGGFTLGISMALLFIYIYHILNDLGFTFLRKLFYKDNLSR